MHKKEPLSKKIISIKFWVVISLDDKLSKLWLDSNFYTMIEAVNNWQHDREGLLKKMDVKEDENIPYTYYNL